MSYVLKMSRILLIYLFLIDLFNCPVESRSVWIGTTLGVTMTHLTEIPDCIDWSEWDLFDFFCSFDDWIVWFCCCCCWIDLDRMVCPSTRTVWLVDRGWLGLVFGLEWMVGHVIFSWMEWLMERILRLSGKTIRKPSCSWIKYRVPTRISRSRLSSWDFSLVVGRVCYTIAELGDMLPSAFELRRWRAIPFLRKLPSKCELTKERASPITAMLAKSP